LLVDFELTLATGTAERDAAKTMLGRLRRSRRVTLGADRGYDTRDFVGACRSQRVTPHVAQYQKGAGRRGSAIDARTTRHAGYGASQKVRKRIEEVFGWMKAFGGLRRTRFRGRPRAELHSLTVATSYNLLRVSRLMATA